MTLLDSTARRSAKRALKVRQQIGVRADTSLNVYDTAMSLSVEVRFVDIPSLEGMYSHGEPATVVISSLRPIVRQVFTCAHELGHHAFGNGEMIDELSERRSSAKVVDPREQEADGFAANLLMPPTAIDAAFSRRHFNRESIGPQELYAVASYFQVGYTTLIRHMQLALKRISWSQAENFVRPSVREVRSQILGRPCPAHLVVVDEHWNWDVPLDCEVGNMIALRNALNVDETYLSSQKKAGQLLVFEAMSPGQTTVEVGPSQLLRVRIARKQYTGRLAYRWEPEVSLA
jgi:Zn-dependent peptidase ImmA (M78 family)